MSSSSLVVTISADINDFSKKLKSMTDDVEKASKTVEKLGESLSIGITAPAAAAAFEFAKLGADSQDTAGRMQRVFGSLADDVEGSIKQMTASVPESQTALEKMAISIDDMLKGVAIAPSKAATMSKSLLTLAGDLAAFNHIDMSQATDVLQHGIEGQTKGLTALGVVITQTDIKNEAYKLGLLSSGNQLTDTGKALAAYQLIMEKTTSAQGEAARTANDSGKSFAFFKASVDELAESLGTLALPALSSFAKSATTVVQAVTGLPDSVKSTAMGIVGVAAVIGPALVGLSKLASGYIALKSAMTLLSEGGSIAGFMATLTNPILATVVAVGLLTAAFVGLYAAWQRFTGKGDASALDTDPSLAAAVGGKGAPDGKDGATQSPLGDKADQLKKNASDVAAAFDYAVQHGQSLVAIMAQVNSLSARAAGMIGKDGDQFGKDATTARAVADQLQQLKDYAAVSVASPSAANALLAGIAKRPYDASTAAAKQAVNGASSYAQDLATRSAASQYVTPFNANSEALIKSRGDQQSVANDLAQRQAALGLSDGFDAAKQAAVELGESQRQTAEQTALAFEKIKQPLDGVGIHLGDLSAGMQTAAVNIFSAVTTFVQGLAQQLGGGSKAAGIGGAIGGLAGGAFLGSKLGVAFGPLGSALGGVAGALIGGGISAIFGGQKQASDAASSSLTTLANTANAVTQALSNIPKGFKIAYDRFLAEAGVVVGGGGAGAGGGSAGSGGSGGGTDTSGFAFSGGGVANGTIVIQGDLHIGTGAIADLKTLTAAVTAGAKASRNRGGSGLLLAAVKA